MANKAIRDLRTHAALKLKVLAMHDDDDPPPRDKGGKPKIKSKDASALPAHLGHKLRTMFEDVESQPVPDRLRELLEKLAAKEKKPE